MIYQVNQYENYSVTSRDSLNFLVDRWLSSLDVMPKSTKTYREHMRRFTSYLEANDIQLPNSQDVREYKKSLQEAGLKVSTVNAYIRAVKMFFGWCSEANIYPDITKGIRMKDTSRGHKRGSLSPTQRKMLLDGIEKANKRGLPEKELRDKALITLMLTTAIRCTEASNASIGDLRTVNDEPVLYIKRKGHEEKDDFVKLPPVTMKAITEYLSSRFPSGTLFPDEPLFSKLSNNQNTGSRLTPTGVSKLVKTLLRAADIDVPELTAHSLRHTAATTAVKNGVPVQKVQRMMGHKQITTTMVYVDDVSREEDETEAIIEKAIFG